MCILLKGSMAYLSFLVLESCPRINHTVTKVTCENSIVENHGEAMGTSLHSFPLCLLCFLLPLLWCQLTPAV